MSYTIIIINNQSYKKVYNTEMAHAARIPRTSRRTNIQV